MSLSDMLTAIMSVFCQLAQLMMLKHIVLELF